jgi:hypothetical protein
MWVRWFKAEHEDWRVGIEAHLEALGCGLQGAGGARAATRAPGPAAGGPEGGGGRGASRGVACQRLPHGAPWLSQLVKVPWGRHELNRAAHVGASVGARGRLPGRSCGRPHQTNR